MPDAYVGTSGGEKKVVAIVVGTSGGNKNVDVGTVGTSGGNKVFFQYLTAPATAPAWYSTYPKDDPDTDNHLLYRLQSVADATEYEIYYRVNASMAGDPVANGTKIGPLTPAQVIDAEYDATISGGSPGDTIYSIARACNAAGCGPFQASEDQTDLVEAPPIYAPTWASTYPKDNPDTDDSLLVKIIAAPDATSYDAYYKVGSGMSGDPIANGGTAFPGNPYTDAQIVSAAVDLDGFTPGDDVYVNVRGRNDGGPGPWMTGGNEGHDVIEYRTPGVPILGTVTVDFVNDELDINWTPQDPQNQTTFRIELGVRNCGSSDSWSLSYSTDPSSPASVPIIIDGGKEYRCRVRAEISGGPASAYSSYSAIKNANQTPGLPTGVGLTYVGVADPTSQLKLNWNHPTSGWWDQYDIELRTYSQSFTGTPTHTASGAATSYTFSTLLDNTHYKARIRASGGSCVSDGSWATASDSVGWTAPSTPVPQSGHGWWSGYPRAKPATDDQLELRIICIDYTLAEAYGHTAAFTLGPSYYLGDFSGSTYTWSGRSANTRYWMQVKFINEAAVGSPHSDATATGTQVAKYTNVQTPQGVNIVNEDYTNCFTAETIDFDVTWSNDNSDAVDRNEAVDIDLYYSGTWHENYTTAPALSTSKSFTDIPSAPGSQQIQVRVNYQSESAYGSDSNVGCPE